MKIWILNHYATSMFYDKGGRHHSFAKYMIRMGYDVKLFCASTVHNSDVVVDTENKISIEKCGEDNVPYVFVKTRPYQGNSGTRILNMLDYYKNIKHVLNDYKAKEGLPDIILASSVHPLALVVGIKVAKKFNIPCICEIRDLWPLTLVELGIIKDKGIVTKLMYKGEHWIYKKADELIFTMPGGEKYIKDKNWDNNVCLKKVHNINNGVDLEKFNKDKERYIINDSDLDDDNIFKIIYAGSIRTANKIDEFISVAENLKKLEYDNVKIIIYGDGDQRERLESITKKLELDNIVFKGRVEKHFIPYILSKGDMNIVSDGSSGVGRYGISWNKIFEYMASGKPTIVNYNMGEYNFVEDYRFGYAREYKNIQEFCNDIISMIEMPSDEYKNYSDNAIKAAQIYDYKNLAEKLNGIIKNVIKQYKSNKI
ncbi:MAG: glycosyltransferase family 4 protein [Anaerovoracaceae bacterium]